ncbi:solute carrier family 28 member 3 isoform X1 [Fopius arisanus]|uniref:Sodium/nucleoside cotransporter n=4 Tax=Braconidae TaxID=7402 RepID=A0A9R1SUL9_9HYME|nr:PREDICTED: solute carrier family 28 member 3 isoform X1 [Fopius arisanus]
MTGVSVFDEVERKISKHSLRISLDLSPENNANPPSGMKKFVGSVDDMEYDKEPESSTSCFARGKTSMSSCFSENRRVVKFIKYSILHAIILVYAVFAGLYWKNNNKNCALEWCDGYGMLLILLGIVYLSLFYFYVIKRYLSDTIQAVFFPISCCIRSIREKSCLSRSLKTSFYVTLLIALVIFLIYDTIDSRDRLISGVGFAIILLFGFVFSKHPTKIDWRPVIWGVILQFVFGLITIRWAIGRQIFECIANKVAQFLDYAKDGATFVFSPGLVDNGVFAFSVLPVIFFFSFMIQILYYWGAMQWVIMKLGWALHWVMGTTVCESLNSAANTFLGMTESPLLIKPYISKLTTSEIHAIMCSGFATVSGTVLAAYISFGAQPSHLITASVMSAPAALCYSKLFYPETEKSQTTFRNIPLQKSEDTSVMDAATKGALAGIPLVLGIVANIVAFVSFIAFLNGILSWIGGLVGFPSLTFEYLLSKAFMPLSWIMGVPWDQCEDVGTLIGLKTVVNEFVAYQKLGEFKAQGRLTPRVEGIATFAICGFSNPGSIGIMMGSLGSIAPEKREQIASVAIRAFIAGSAVCFLTASIAGMLMNEDFYAPAVNATTMSAMTTSS